MGNTGDELPPWVERGTQGFVFATTGEKYTVLARRAARNLRLHMPDCKIDLFTDQVVDDPVFNRIHDLGHSWFRPKIQAIRDSRFHRSIVLDADIIVVADITEVFQVLEQCDIAGAEASGSRSRLMIPPDKEVPRSFPPVNSGFLAVRASQRLCEFSRSWEDALRESGSPIDQPSLRKQLYRGYLKFLPLGGEYNLIELSRLDNWVKVKAAPRVIHVRSLHEAPPGDPETPFSLSESIGNARAAHVERLIATDWSLGGDSDAEAIPPGLPNQNKLGSSLLENIAYKIWRKFRQRGKSPASRKSQRYTSYQTAVLALAAGRDCIRICIIGANDGRFGDPIYTLVRNALAAKTEMLLFEPQEYLAPYLSQHYAFHPRHKIVTAAIGSSSELLLHAVIPEAWTRLQPRYAKGWPNHRAPTGITSSNRDFVTRWVHKHCPEEPDPGSLVAELRVPCSPLVEALDKLRSPRKLDVLQIDVEGMDDEVLFACDIEQTAPSIIYLEIAHLPPDRVQKLRQYLETDYFLSVINRDLLAIRRA